MDIKPVKAQTEKYFHTIFNVYVHDGYVSLAEKLNEIMPCRGDVKKTYFANSGAECDENAIKIAKAYTGRSGVICFTGAFHGRTNLTMALTAKKVYAQGMGPFPAGTIGGTFCGNPVSCAAALAVMDIMKRDDYAAKLIGNALQKGLLLESCGTAGNVIRFLAPLTMTDEQMARGLEIFEESLKEAIGE